MVSEPQVRQRRTASICDESDEDEPLLILRPASGHGLPDLREIWLFRDLLLALALRDIKLRYRQTALGAFWVILQPLIAAAVFSFVFGRVANMPSGGVPYFVLSYSGLLAWNMFSNTLTKASGSLVQNSQLVSKVYFPRVLVPLSTVFSSLVDFGVALVMMGVLLIVYRMPLTLSVLLLPVWVLLVLALSIGCGLFAAALMVTYRDVQYVVPVLTQFLMFASPVGYAVSSVSEHLRLVYILNPLSGLLEAFRWSLLGHGRLNAAAVVNSAVCSIVAFAAGSCYFRSVERKFADVI
jgi:lipopolysaccharide transport system permease protein